MTATAASGAVSLPSGLGHIPLTFGRHHRPIAAPAAVPAQPTNSSEETA